MPRTIYETKAAGIVYPQQRPAVPERFVYIGATVLSLRNGWEWRPVYNRDRNSWVLLNRLSDGVDWEVRNVSWNSASGYVNDWDSPDYLEYTFTLSQLASENGAVVSSKTWTLADDTREFPIPDLKPETWYSANLVAKYTDEAGGGTTSNSIQKFKTSVNPTPLAPVLSYKNPTNSQIELFWTDPPGSTAVKYRVYAGIGNGGSWVVGDPGQMPTTGKAWTCIRLAPDTRYYYQVAGINASGMEGPKSNRVQVATGHEASFNSGALQEFMNPYEVGSYRPDICWKLWYSRRADNVSMYQGYWQGDPRTTGPTPTVIPSQESGRYWGCVRFDIGEFRARLDRIYGGGVWQNLEPWRTEFVRVYRMRTPGNVNGQYMTWNLGFSDPFTGGRPTIVSSFRNAGYNDEDHIAAQDTIRAGTAIDWLRLPRYFGKALVRHEYYGTSVNSIILNRMDHINTGYGTAGYGEWAGHLRRDRAYPNDAWRYSDWRILISGSYRVQTRAYQAPYAW